MRKNESYCLSPHMTTPGGHRPIETIHLHSDGSWWAWVQPGVEQGPFASQTLAEEAFRTFSAGIEKPPIQIQSSWWVVIAIGAVALYYVIMAWQASHRHHS